MTGRGAPWRLLAGNLLILRLIILAWLRLSAGEAVAWLGTLLVVDWQIVRRWGGDDD